MPDIDPTDIPALERHASYFWTQFEAAERAWNEFRDQLVGLPGALAHDGESARLPEIRAALERAGLPQKLVDELLAG